MENKESYSREEIIKTVKAYGRISYILKKLEDKLIPGYTGSKYLKILQELKEKIPHEFHSELINIDKLEKLLQ